MGKSFRKDDYNADGSSHLLFYDPEKLTVVTDKSHPLYDERVTLPLDEALIFNMMVFGVKVPVTVRLNGERDGVPVVEVVDGRQRVRNAIEANKRLVKEGKEPIRVPAKLEKADSSTLMGIMISTNELRRDDGPLVKAHKLQRYLATGKTEEEAAITFGVSTSTVRNWLMLVQLNPKVQKAIDAGTVPATIAKELAKLPEEEQPAVLESMIANGATKGVKASNAVRNVTKKDGKPSTKGKMMSRPALEAWKKLLKEQTSKQSDIAYAVVSYVLGNRSALANYPQLRELAQKSE